MTIMLQISLSMLVLILVGLVLLGINHFLHCDDTLTSSETDKLKEEPGQTPKVITRRSVFHNFLARSK